VSLLGVGFQKAIARIAGYERAVGYEESRGAENNENVMDTSLCEQRMLSWSTTRVFVEDCFLLEQSE
jgi:hypothetical protein